MHSDQGKAVHLLGASIILGILGVALFNGSPWGMNILVWAVAAALGVNTLARRFEKSIPMVVRLLGFGVLLFAASFGFRDAPELKLANGIALFLVVGTLLVRTPAGNFAQATILDLSVRAIGAWFKLTADFVRLLTRDIEWKTDRFPKERVQAALRGLLIALPLMLVFGLLFASADDAFRAALTNAFSLGGFDPNTAARCAAIFLFCAVLTAGSYRVLLTENASFEGLSAAVPYQRRLRLGITEISVVLGMLNALFAAFVVVQAEYFFGGLQHLKSVAGLTYAEYARHGFFELTAVSALALGTIIGLHALLDQPSRYARSFTLLAGALASFIAVILMSAFERMDLYIGFAGLTELRLYTIAFMVWIGATLVWLSATVLAGRAPNFAAGSFAAGLLTILSLNIVNPDALIAQYNLSQSSRPVDLAYLESLSLDAAPVVLSGTGRLSANESEKLRADLDRRWSRQAAGDWRGLDWAKWRFLSSKDSRPSKSLEWDLSR